MSSNENISSKSYWFVGASYGKGSEDQSEGFLKEGIRQNKNGHITYKQKIGLVLLTFS